MTLDDFPPALVQRANELGFQVRLGSDWVMLLYGYSAYLQPEQKYIAVSGSYGLEEAVTAFAHELGHAEQVAAGTIYLGQDALQRFNQEMDAVARGSKLGVDMTKNYWTNHLNYADQLGIYEMGRS